MRKFWLDQLTYTDLSGRRYLRRYMTAALAAVILAGLLFLWSSWPRQQAAASVAAPLEQPLPVGRSVQSGPPILPQPVAAAAPAPAAARPLQPVQPALAACPEDPDSWSLEEVVPEDHYQRITPACVYAGLARTVAWELLSHSLGYNGPAAAQLLGLSEIPRRPAGEVLAFTNRSGPLSIALVESGKEAAGNHTAVHLWQVDAAGQPGAVYTLRGCFRSPAQVGNLVGAPTAPYPVLCALTLDQAEWVVMASGAEHYAVHITPRRLVQLFGYLGEGRWVEIGTQRAPVVQIGAGTVQVAPVAMESQQLRLDREKTAALQGTVPWDAAWLAAGFGFKMVPLPPDWQTATSPDRFRALQAVVQAAEGDVP